ncbi:MAG: hypothetical protein KF912_10650 [Phycisphaeraceae bacterium]|nr:hypothetical protein [Phycisphaeraceae bacterium]MBX3367758.1 hypothetical protein [Phycisphaeraceae bacterium]
MLTTAKLCSGLVLIAVSSGVAAMLGDRVGDPFSLRDCPVAYHEIGELQDPVVRVYDGREIRFCCEDCVEGFQEDLTSSLAEVDKEMAKDQAPFYPTTQCLISGEHLGSAGDVVEVVWHNRLVRFCCDACATEFRKDPAATIAKLDQVVKTAQSAGYPLSVCLIAGEELGEEEATEIVIANRLVRLCCEGCAGEFFKNPGVHIAKLDEAWKKAKPEMFAPQADGKAESAK